MNLQLMNSSFGTLAVGSAGGRLCMCDWVGGKVHARNVARLQHAAGDCFVDSPSQAISAVMILLDEYFAGRCPDFGDVPLFLAGTPFQCMVWEALRQIPYGAVWTYGQLAEYVWRPDAVRAVAAAVAANPLSIVLPCHRVVGAGGRLTGYAGGIDVKRRLLGLESSALSGI